MDKILDDFLYLLIDVILVRYQGWVFFLMLLIWMFYKLHITNAQKRLVAATPWVFLKIKIEELSERSPLAMEQVFAALHAIHQNFTWGERFDGKQIMWLSCEIVSIGGKVSYVFKIPERYRNLLESAIFAQYPKAEIFEVDDYLKNLSKFPHVYNPETAEFEFWGTQQNKKKDNAYPIRTYGAFEHPEQKTFVDPLAGVLEAMSNIHPHELLVSQIVIRPTDDAWKEKSKRLLDELKGAPKKHQASFVENAVIAVPGVLMDFIVALFSPPKTEGARAVKEKDEPPSQMLHKTEGEKQVIASIEHGLTKLSYEAKARLLYLAPKAGFNKALRVPEIIGSYRNFDDVSLNGLKPDLKKTWTDVAYKVSEKVEQRWLQFKILARKRRFLYNFLERSFWRGSGNTILNTEELATLYHFPVAPNVRVSQIERVEAVKSAPPADLPIG